MMLDPRTLLRRMFEAAIAAAQPALCVLPHLPAVPDGRLIVLGAGKASAAMARAVEDHWCGGLSGLVVTRYGYGVPCAKIEIVEAAHPVPDAAGLAAARRIHAIAASACPDDTVLCLISGGGSSLLALPAQGLTLDNKQTVNRALLRSGATISELNCVRRHLSRDQRRPSRGVSLSGQGCDPLDFRRARRRSCRYRLRANRGGRYNMCRRTRDCEAL